MGINETVARASCQPQGCAPARLGNAIERLPFQYVEQQTEEICLEAVKQYAWGLRYVREQTEEICLAAVKQDGLALELVLDQTEAICLAAVRQDPEAIEYVKKPFRHLFEEGAPGEAPDATPHAGTAPGCR